MKDSDVTPQAPGLSAIRSADEVSATRNLEVRVRKMAHSLPPSDLGSTRAIQAITRFVEDEIQAALRKASGEQP